MRRYDHVVFLLQAIYLEGSKTVSQEFVQMLRQGNAGGGTFRPPPPVALLPISTAPSILHTWACVLVWSAKDRFETGVFLVDKYLGYLLC